MSQSDFTRCAKAIRFLCDSVREQPALAEVAAQAGVSEFHFQRMFRRWAGISPKRFLQYLTLGEAKGLLMDSRSMLDASLAVGLSSPSRLHDLFLSLECMTPGQFKEQGRGLRVGWTVVATPFGEALLAALDGRLCGLAFLEDGDPAKALAELRGRWPRADFPHDPAGLAPLAEALESRFRGEPPKPLSLLLQGSPFQLKVWEALLAIPEGRVLSYGDLARTLGDPGAARAVGAAVGRNPIALLIPCHRIIQASGALGGYHWGAARKRVILALERGRANGLLPGGGD
ncbi:bifunctional helix-turn-helix domain-containing protein/methylated-DNA--[protein]-cysteine S-methyltransferase [Mesoterricola silvestris]|uniref:methylated-DNA--[protein]-cysteine S-methyltransferase n=1 Tax=Mesoterricola silvestris TaxID=2927979 RepID=A0AA48GLL3_9BACT|nr:bifunctional helix-turn-helix domain-containing protein/methylated-DNA--[protein]-cysteine S-methyltransferase [Mesoterricola silvestris]BDU72059.1 6-O-methylguanine DNA methyltransferase [Mesoterricola silvestris]